ncbi:MULTISPECIES: histidine phosphatase family protein [Rhizobium]|uniref:Phosphoglycerate mutase n=1 Tax=Rhizobium favelukesii TaxID=348824 RepID=W6RDV1_9HYPH|nr:MULTISPECIES: histidine phosphatase family protein [Rhizobium]MCA0803064.1 histidine phosphatase family protein [Rhizobium sp. T1473]MCS0460075.1 histidine phosphatase family protein [Rhizobium favelukesii]UFS83389.1 histidine phosphatase family protein [Rhizobium sp. T136]CDM59029.1 phosphoglycerate mutase [Rhizobium favelukesii]
MTRLTWICHGSTAANREARFPLDEPLNEKAVIATQAIAPRLRHADNVFASPTLRTRQTADALGLQPAFSDALADCDFGRWAGRSIAEIQQLEPENLAAWMARPEEAPHGGEAIAAVCTRVNAWLSQRLQAGGHIVAITHAAVIRAAIISTLNAPVASFWIADIEPLAIVHMTSNGSRWSLRVEGATA